MDAEYDASESRARLLEEVRANLEVRPGRPGRRGRKRSSKLAQLLEAPRPVFVPSREEGARSYAEHMDQYYRLDCEDVIAGDLRTRFKYRDCLPNSYGLTLDEILLADDKELNAWVSLKKAMRRQAPSEEAAARDKYTRRAQDDALKRRLLPSLYRHLPQEPEIVVSPKNEAKSTNNKIQDSCSKAKVIDVSEDKKKDSLEDQKKSVSMLRIPTQHENETIVTTLSTGKSKKKKRKRSVNEFTVEDITSAETYLMNSAIVSPTKRKKKKHKSGSFSASSNNISLIGSSSGINEDTIATKSKVFIAQTEIQNDLAENSNPNNNDDEGKRNVKNDDAEKKKKKKTKNKNKSLNNTIDNQNRELNKSKEIKLVKQKKKNLGKINKHKNKMGYKKLLNKTGASTNPLETLSDERLKAYGLNPKKYRNFLKYKK